VKSYVLGLFLEPVHVEEYIIYNYINKACRKMIGCWTEILCHSSIDV